MSLESVKYKRGSFQVLDQLKVPHECIYRDIKCVEDAVDAIKTMQVRGAPLIAIVGCLSIAIELENNEFKDTGEIIDFVRRNVKSCIDARPTAVNMRREGLRLIERAEELIMNDIDDPHELKLNLIKWIEDLLQIDLDTNRKIGEHGAQVMAVNNEEINVLTHCNTGSLATAGIGTALGCVRELFKRKNLGHCYFTETRPYNQGSRLTSFELLNDKIPSTLVCDSAVSWLMKNKKIHAVVVGADRVVKNGDTANKIGTYQLAIVAKAHGVKFYIAAPFSTIDPTIETGDSIIIEQRSPDEVTTIFGKRISPEGINVLNPAFDVTPAEFISGIITERGCFTPAELYEILSKPF